MFTLWKDRLNDRGWTLVGIEEKRRPRAATAELGRRVRQQSHDPAPGVRGGRRMGWKKALLFSVVPLLVVLLTMEVGARVLELWLPPATVDFGHGFDPESRLFVPLPGNPRRCVTHPVKEAAFHRQSFENPKPKGTFRIAVIGESSVYRLARELPGLEQRLERTLAGRFRDVEILNAGGMSYGSQRLVPVSAEIVAYQPDLVFVYVGHNEFEEVEQLTLASVETLALRRSLSRSAAFRFFRDSLGLMTVRQWERDHNSRLLSKPRPDWARAWKHKFTGEDVRTRMSAFRNNISMIISMCRQNNIPVIIGTVPSNLVKPALPKEEWRKYQPVWDLLDKQQFEQAAVLGQNLLKEVAGRHQSSALENAIIRQLAAEYKIPLADVEAAVTAAEPHHVPGETLFADHCHLNEVGNRILIETYEAEATRLLANM